MSWVLVAVWVAVTTCLIGWLRGNPQHTPKLWMLFGILPFLENFLHGVTTPIEWGWRGEASGLELSLLDVLSLGILMTFPRTNLPFPFRISFAFYFFAVLLSVLWSQVPMASLFYVWNLARMFLVCVVVTRACRADDRVPESLLKGFAMGLCFQAVFAAVQYLALGVSQAGGTIGHRNLLGMMIHFVSFPFFALMLSDARELLVTLVPIAAVTAAMATGSRATIGLEIGGFMLVFLLSALRQWTPRKVSIAAAGLVIITILIPIVLIRFEERGATLSDFFAAEDRANFQQLALTMLADHPLGIGPNNFVVVGVQGYYQRSNVSWVGWGSMVHNVYLLVAVESGYIGITAFVIMLLQPMIAAFRCGWRHRGDRRGDLLIGFGVSLLIVYIHGLVEFEFIMREPQYMFGISVGIVGGLVQRLGYWQRASRPLPPITLGATQTQPHPSRAPL